MKWMILTVLLWPLAAVASQPSTTEGTSVLVKVVPLNQHTLQDTVTAYGTVSTDPSAMTSLNAGHEAVVASIGVSAGDPVSAGTTLLTLETAPAAREAYQQAVAGVDYARRQLQRQQRLLKQQLATSADVASARKALQDARATLDARRHEGSDRTRTPVKAPFDGVVTLVNAEAGQHLHRGDALLTLAGSNRFLVPLGVSPAIAARIDAGAAVRITPVFGHAVGVDASVYRVQRVARPNTGMVSAVARVKGSGGDTLMAGMPVIGVITVAKANTLAVPRSAVLHDDQGDYLFIVENGNARRINVHSGVHSGKWIGVSGDGLSSGQSVVVRGNYELHDGDRVRESQQ